MTPDDPRHGTDRGYRAGCHERCCLNGTALYQRRRSKLKAMGRNGRVNPAGTVRRIQALQALGWTFADIAAAGGFPSGDVVQKTIRESTAWVVPMTVGRSKAAYAKLSMTPGPSAVTRTRSRRAGYLPPLAWDDATIDNPDARPYPAEDDASFVDDVLVQRAMSGQRVQANRAEKEEITRRWKAAEKSLNELDRIQGWNVWRDRRQMRKAS